jgi:hypothetical protein
MLGMINLINPSQTTIHLILMATPDLGVYEFLNPHLEAVTSIWGSNNFTETK